MPTQIIDARVLLKSVSLNDLKQWAFPHWVLWATVLGLFVCNAIWVALSLRISITPDWFTLNFTLIAGGFGGLLLRFYKGHMFDGILYRLWCLLMTCFMAAVLMGNLQVLNHLTMANSLPIADERLLAWDRALGLDWLAYAKFITSSNVAKFCLSTAYYSFTMGGLGAVAVISIALNNRPRTLEIIFLVVSTALICILLAPFFPARGTMDLLSDTELRSRLPAHTGANFIDQLLDLRGNSSLMFVPANMEGTAAYPSFHTCLGLILLWCSRGWWPTATLGALIGAAIVAATPVYGGHYFVDVLAGASILILMVWLWRSKFAPHVVSHIDGDPVNSPALPAWMSKFRRS